MAKTLRITLDDGPQEAGVARYRMWDGERSGVLWFSCDARYEKALARDRGDCVIVALFLSAMKAGYERIETDLAISQKLYMSLTGQVIPQFYEVSKREMPQIELVAPLTTKALGGTRTCTGLSCGVDSFCTLQEYGPDFELEDYHMKAVTYYRVGAHGHRVDSSGGTEREDQKFNEELERTRRFCEEFGYELIEAQSNMDDVLIEWFADDRFYRTHVFRNAAMALFLQGLIRTYFCSPGFNLTDFRVTFTTAIGHFDKWLLPLLDTEGLSFYSSNRWWSRLDKIEQLVPFEPCHDYLQVCLVREGNCLSCKKCRRTLMELDALGEEALEAFAGSFDVEGYKRTRRKRWFDKIYELKDGGRPDAGSYDDLYMHAAKHHPELLGDFVRERREGVEWVTAREKGIALEYPCRAAAVKGKVRKGKRLPYLGETGKWVAVELPSGERAFVDSAKVKLS